MDVTFLGTGTSQGIPIIGSEHPVCLSNDSKDKRLRVSILITWNDLNILIDCGPDFRQQMLANNVQKLDAIFYTHEHNDHTAGLDDIRPFFFRQGDIPVFAHQRVLTALRKRFDYIFTTENKYPGAPGVTEHIIENKPFSFHGLTVTPVEFMHNRLQVFGFRVEDFAYLTDLKTIEEQEIEKLRDLKVLVVSALRIEPHHSHFNLEEALEFIEKVQPEKAYLTHISHMLGFHEEVEKDLPANVHLAYDNLKITV
ncbi:MBL fold metallo-hydrolase [Christiangramia forsetii]|uniref:Metallo-beta-lactamase domain protein n=2 Tax=Christiangramia forsetii TaxID=411153 RepID=A0M1C8_CHRFK|nr:MBL fold metallo-hydrolase [Christiangramia forsetii]GGG42843.1 MBL fold metallo-hydrolase [Christiangramia forsetii]CAL66423.1 metallo-beta-lactamase domain protein [Christiangramia forsetii KT0803]